jgi:nitroreductase
MKSAIEKRISVRSYFKKPLTDEDCAKVKDILNSYKNKKGPFNNQVDFFFTENKNTTGNKIGTYGFVKNPPAFIGGVVKNTTYGMIDFGFLFEEIILKLTNAGLGTVWLGGTFNRSDFSVDVKEDEILAAISPVGYPTNQSIREKMIRGLSRANKRLPFNELFFLGESLEKIDKSHKYYHCLEAVQAGPSASNKQPWRIVVIKNTFHFFIKRTKGYGNLLKMDIQAIDIGIALSHLYLYLQADKYTPHFIEDKPFDIENLEYIISIVNN